VPGLLGLEEPIPTWALRTTADCLHALPAPTIAALRRSRLPTPLEKEPLKA
jgi:hypothetical protein